MDSNMKEIKLLLNEVFAKRLKGDIRFTESMRQEDVFSAYRKIVACSNVVKGVQRTDASILYDICCLRSKCAKSLAEAVFSLSVYLAQQNQDGQNVYLCAPDSNGPEMSLEMVEQVLTALDAEMWTQDTLKEKIPTECKTAINCEEDCPGVEAGYQDVITLFEVNIFPFPCI
jgi:hypothetical protein